jgi:hypothetical protein
MRTTLTHSSPCSRELPFPRAPQIHARPPDPQLGCGTRLPAACSSTSRGASDRPARRRGPGTAPTHPSYRRCTKRWSRQLRGGGCRCGMPPSNQTRSVLLAALCLPATDMHCAALCHYITDMAQHGTPCIGQAVSAAVPVTAGTFTSWARRQQANCRGSARYVGSGCTHAIAYRTGWQPV